MLYPTMSTILLSQNGISSSIELYESPQSVIFALSPWKMGQSHLGNCDEPAASEFCRRSGYERAIDWKWDYVPQTRTLSAENCDPPARCGGLHTWSASERSWFWGSNLYS